MFKRILTLGMAGGKSDIEVLLDTVKPYIIEPRIGYSKKEMEKSLISLVGKNLENVVSDFDNLFSLRSWFQDKFTDVDKLMEYMLRGSAVFFYLSGSGAKLAQKLALQFQEDRANYKYPFYVRIDSSIVEDRFLETVMENVDEYARLSGDKKVLSLFPKKCKACDRTITFDPNIYVDSEDEEETVYTRLDNDGECMCCGALIEENMLKPILKIYPLIRKFEEEKGKHILPRVS